MSILEKKFGSVGKKGDSAEEWVMNKLSSVYQVEDLRNDWKSQIDGIDFGITKSAWKNTYYLDSKGNLNGDIFYLEMEKNGKPGWFMKSKSDRIYHIDVNAGRGYWYSLPDMRLLMSKMGVTSGLYKIDVTDIKFKNLLRIIY